MNKTSLSRNDIYLFRVPKLFAIKRTDNEISKINDGGIVVGLNFGAGRQPLL